MTKKQILISTSSFGEYDPTITGMLEKAGIQVLPNLLKRTLKPHELVEHAKDCVGIIAGTEKYDRAILEKLHKLKVLSRCGAGTDAIDMDAIEERGILLFSTPYGPTQAVAELMMGLILSLLRHVHLTNAMIKRGHWEKPMGFLVGELKFGIIGLGKIGKRLATLLRHFDATVMGCDIYPDTDWAAQNNVTLKDQNYILRESDVVCLHLPYEDDLHHFIGKETLANMKPGSFLINASRGGLIDEEALYQALKTNHLQGAALDTFEREPYNGPLRELDNVILTPHIGSYARDGRVRMEREAAENLLKGLTQCGALHHPGNKVSL